MSTGFENEIAEILKKHGLAGKKLLLWVSGGVDSVAMFHLLHSLREKGLAGALEVAHVDHGLREDSHKDALFVEKLAREAGHPFHLVRLAKTDFGRGVNVQARARELRREKLEALRVERGLNASCLAHHAGDQAETALFKLIRGAGPRGVSGMDVWSPPIFRPLLHLTKGEIENLARLKGWAHREDPTNRTPKYSRNRVRNELIPLAREIAPGADEAIVRFASLIKDDESLLTRLAHGEYERLARIEPEGVRFETGPLIKLEPALLRRVILALAEKLCGSAEHLSHSHVLEIEKLLEPGSAQRKAPVPGLPHFYRCYGDLWAVDPVKAGAAFGAENLRPASGPAGLVPSGQASVPLPPGRPSGEIILRPRKPGDRLGGKKVKDILMEAKIPRWRRAHAIVAEDREGTLAVFAGTSAFGAFDENSLNRLWLEKK